MDTGSRRESVGELRWWLSRAVSAKEMSNASGVKHAATEPNQLDDKRERRRGTSTRAAGRAAGRAAALRRAPSDSDCSAETASLSADSGDRSVRPAIPPPRTTKSRSRRRGSEWEVLEGLKDGQRFEKRPEVFNGYLHKKRKWPLKGWHKRFFVVDGGILVYARSPTDVARGRLHGSVDVGLSVISAKARRRRIDIDADEFIYHLRAKTPDVFRTWLNVLKTHRLYRQHLLTFGARESVAKIHAPLDELGPTENSSRTTSFSSHIRQIPGFPVPYLVLPSPMGSSSNSCGSETLSCTSGDGSFETQIDQNMFRNRSLCSVECPKDRSMFVSLCSWSSETEKLKVDFSNQLSKHSDAASTNQKTHKSKNDVKNALKGKFKVNKNIQYLEGKMPADKDNSPTYFFFSRHKRCEDNTNQPLVRKSRKSTNVVKYKNKFDEPVLNKPLYDYTVLGKYKKKDSKAVYINVCNDSEKLRNNIHTRKTSQSPRCSNSLNLTMSDYDALVEKLMLSICKNGIRMKQFKTYNMKSYLNKIIDELYGMKLDSGYDNTVKELFRCLLEYWLKHTLTSFKNSTRSNKCTAKQSKELFMKDNTTSNIFVPQISMSTQIYVYGGDLEEKTPDVNAYHKNLQRKNNLSILNKKINSYVNEKRIQDIEEVMWNTVYVCETMRSDHSKEKDIKITRKLIDNLDGATDRSRNLNANNTIALMSDSSNEVSQIKETLDQLICDASIPSCVAQDFLRLYLNLLHDKSASESTSITGESDSNNGQVQCDVQTESVVKKMSISVSTKELSNKMDDESKKDSQVYIQPVLDKISGLFAINCNNTYNIARKYCDKGPSNYSNVNNNNVELHTNKISSQVDLSKTCLINTIRNKNLNYLDDTVTRSFEKSNYIDGIDLKPYESCGNMKLDSDIASECIKPDVNIPTHRKLDVIDREIVNPEYRPSARLITKDDDDMQPCYMMSLGENNVTKKLKQNNITDTKNKCKTPHPVNPLRSVNFNEEISIFDNPPKIVDEKSILLLVEQLATLSRSVPTIHKDINSLFIKLRKKYEKNLSGKMHGLSLLGKIYSDEPKTRDKESQYPTDIICNLTLDRTTSTHTDIYNKSIGTNDCQTKYTNKSNKFGDTDIETNLGSKSLCVDAANNITHMTITTQTSSIGNVTSVELSKSDKAISNQNWHEYDQGISSVVQYVLNASPRKSYVILEEGENRRLKQRYCPKTKENLMEEISKLREFKVSTQSQTEDRLRCLHSKPANTDYKVYQLFLCHKYATKKSNSAVNLGDKLKSDDDLWTIYKCSSDSYISGLVSPTSPPIRGPQAGFVSGTPGGRLASWIIESGGPLDNASRELGQAQLSVQQLQRLLDALELQQQAHHDTDVSLEGASPNVKKDRRKFGLRKKKSSNKCASVELAPPQIDASNSHTAISALTAPPSPGGGASSVPNSAASLPIACAATRPQSLPGAEILNAPASLSSLTPDHQLREDFTILAKDLVSSLKTIVATLVCERARLRAAMEAADSPAPPGGVLATLRSNLSSALQQNSELRTRLARIHDASDLAEVSSLGHNSELNRRFPHSLSYSSSCVSASEFFDAEEHDEGSAEPERAPAADEPGVIELDGDSSSEAGSLSSEDGSASSDNSDAVTRVEDRTAHNDRGRADGVGGETVSQGVAAWTRRTRLPHARPSPAPPSLWNLLYKNIGKDLSQISMPVTINEPLNMLQRLCEELEYSELLDAAARCEHADERCALVAAFAVSAYAATAHRAASKPFNPLLAETYECVRADRGFNFLAEQVSHHPPVSACHAESPLWVFWQEARIKTKFWGKSMEFQPAGRVHVRLLTTGDHYSWNKVTTCVHNLFGGQRWVDQYGDMLVTCHGTDVSCKLNFIKASSWSNSRHEVRGAVAGARGARLRLQGRWTEALNAGDSPAARCLWRPGAMPADHDMYYGFTRFAMELNELEPGMKEVLPHTDTRLRPDQRALEEGDVDAAEQLKLELEQAQRERRRNSPEHAPAWFRKATEEGCSGEEAWVFTGEYWRARDAGFPNLRAPRLW